MSTDPVSAPENHEDDVPVTDGGPTTSTAHEVAAQVEAAGEAVPVTRPVNDAPTDDFIGTRRLTDEDTGSRMTI